MSKLKNILILSPHTDDGEFGCGGAIRRYIEEGHNVIYVAFSDCKESIPEGFSQDTLEKEMRNATKTLGIHPDQTILLDYQVRYFSRDRQAILEDMVKLNKKYNPDIIFTPSSKDIHQDHSTITNEAIRAFKRCTIYGYEFPWNLLELPSTMFIELSEKQLEVKIASIGEYKSQVGRSYSDPEYIKALAVTRGKRIFVEYAEVFEVIRIIDRL